LHSKKLFVKLSKEIFPMPRLKAIQRFVIDAVFVTIVRWWLYIRLYLKFEVKFIKRQINMAVPTLVRAVYS
jgi:hypothetical protein